MDWVSDSDSELWQRNVRAHAMKKTFAAKKRLRFPQTAIVATDKTYNESKSYLLGKNLSYEMAHAGFSAQEVEAKIGGEYKAATIAKLAAGEVQRPEKNLLLALSKLFGYPDPDSLSKPWHIEVRETMPTKQPTVETTPKSSDSDFAEIIHSMNRSMTTTDEETKKVVERLLGDQRFRTYLSIAIHWIAHRATGRE